MNFSCSFFFFFFNDTATTEIYTLSLHDALPIFLAHAGEPAGAMQFDLAGFSQGRSEEHTSELQSRFDVVCRLLLAKKTSNVVIDLLICRLNSSFILLSMTNSS